MALQRINTAFGPNPIRFNGNIQPQANANVFLGNTTFQFSTIYASTFSGTATHANLAYYLASGTEINPSLANVAGNIVGYATTVTANVNTGAIVSRGGLGVADVAMIGGNLVAAATTVSTSATTGALVVNGGAGIAGNVFTSGWIVPTSNTTQNLGTTTSWWGTFYGVSTQARYADLAESYAADQTYDPGTVMTFGGTAEITQSTKAIDPSVAGVVSTDPAHLMNAFQIGSHIVNVALVGRVPCKVVGQIHKGDRLVTSDIPGVAMKMPQGSHQPGVLIGKALQDYNSDMPGMIEVAVGRS